MLKIILSNGEGEGVSADDRCAYVPNSHYSGWKYIVKKKYGETNLNVGKKITLPMWLVCVILLRLGVFLNKAKKYDTFNIIYIWN